jgi:outer membrane protein TolC
MRRVLHCVAWLGALAAASSAAAQNVRPARDSIGYRELLANAVNADPRQQQLRLQETATELRLRSIAAERLPSLALDGQGQYQSAVTKIAIPLPGVVIPTPPHDTYDAHLGAEQSLLDPTLAPRREVEGARLAEARAQIRSTLFGLRQEVTDAFFTAAGLQERIAETDAAIADLAVRLRETVARFHEGTALRADTASIAATLAERRQDRLTIDADRAAALARLALLAGRSIPADAVLVPPSVAALAREVARSADTLRTRPEFQQFAATRERLARQGRLASAQERPRVSAFARVGYGRPGLNMLSSDFQSYWLAGVRVHWSPFNWGATERDRELLDLEREIVTTNEAAFAQLLERAAQPSLATIARLDSTLALDERVIALREQLVRDARAQLDEGVITATTYADRSTDLLTARLRRVQHRVALEHARVTLLNTLGVEIP